MLQAIEESVSVKMELIPDSKINTIKYICFKLYCSEKIKKHFIVERHGDCCTEAISF